MFGPYDFGFTIEPLYQVGRQSVLPAFFVIGDKFNRAIYGLQVCFRQRIANISRRQYLCPFKGIGHHVDGGIGLSAMICGRGIVSGFKFCVIFFSSGIRH